MQRQNEWAIVLAAGDGTRLAALTDQGGAPVPKQYWSLRGPRSLLGDALARAGQLVARERTVVVVAARHRALWEAELAHLPPENVIVQPENRGTAAGLLLPLISVLRRDPAARVAVLPSDHHVEKEYVLGISLRLAFESLGRDASRVVLLGISPSAPETGYGWILPRPEGGGLERVAAFVEKPRDAVARALFARGGVWNSFLMVASGHVLLQLFREHLPLLVEDLSRALDPRRPEALDELYARLASADVSRDVLQASADRLWLLRVPACGWTDLGTPERVAECLERQRSPARATRARERVPPSARFDLASVLGRLRAPVGVA